MLACVKSKRERNIEMGNITMKYSVCALLSDVMIRENMVITIWNDAMSLEAARPLSLPTPTAARRAGAILFFS